MAETFVARRDDAVEQLVCVKRVLPAFNTDKDFVTQFVREARVAAKLRHSNIVGILDFGEVDTEHYMALELVDGVDMRGLLQMETGERLGAELAAMIAIQIAYALEYAHASEGGIVHRDVTPSNILLSTHGEVKLADFGVAKALTGTSVATATGFIKGKVPYMAPEQMRGADIDGRVDLFSLGVTLFEALAGRRPFVGKHDVEVMMKVLEGDRPKLAEVAPDVPSGLAEVVERLLAPKPEDRFADAGEVVDALAPFVGNEEEARDRLADKVRAAYGSDTTGDMATRDTEMAVQLPRVVDPVEPAVALETAARVEAVEPSARRVLPLAVGMVVLILIGGLGAFALQSDPEVEPTEPDPVAMASTMQAETIEEQPPLPRGELPPVEMEPEPVATMMSEMTMSSEMVTMSGMVSAMDDSEMESEMVSRRRGRVHVVVRPWGNVFFRGMRERTPYTLTLPVGRQRIQVGYESPTVTRFVTVEANKTQELRINLEGE